MENKVMDIINKNRNRPHNLKFILNSKDNDVFKQELFKLLIIAFDTFWSSKHIYRDLVYFDRGDKSLEKMVRDYDIIYLTENNDYDLGALEMANEFVVLSTEKTAEKTTTCFELLYYSLFKDTDNYDLDFFKYVNDAIYNYDSFEHTYAFKMFFKQNVLGSNFNNRHITGVMLPELLSAGYTCLHINNPKIFISQDLKTMKSTNKKFPLFLNKKEIGFWLPTEKIDAIYSINNDTINFLDLDISYISMWRQESILQLTKIVEGLIKLKEDYDLTKDLDFYFINSKAILSTTFKIYVNEIKDLMYNFIFTHVIGIVKPGEYTVMDLLNLYINIYNYFNTPNSEVNHLEDLAINYKNCKKLIIENREKVFSKLLTLEDIEKRFSIIENILKK